MNEDKDNLMNRERAELDLAREELARFLEGLSDTDFSRIFRTPVFTEQVLNAASVSPAISARLDALMRISFLEMPAADQTLIHESAERLEKRFALERIEHPSADETLRFLAGVLPEASLRKIRRHVESGCSACGPLLGVIWLRDHAATLVRQGAHLIRFPLSLPAPSLGFAPKDEPQELYREQIHTDDLVVLVEQDRDEVLVRIRAANGKTVFRAVYIALLSPLGPHEAEVPWEAEHYWPAQHRFPDFDRLVAVEDFVSIILSPIPTERQRVIEDNK